MKPTVVLPVPATRGHAWYEFSLEGGRINAARLPDTFLDGDDGEEDDGQGSSSARKIRVDAIPSVTRLSEEQMVTLPPLFWLGRGGKEYVVPPGLTAVYAGTGVGKTVTLKQSRLARRVGDRVESAHQMYVNFGEPFNDTTHAQDDIVAWTFLDAFIKAAYALLDDSVPVIDSFRTLVYTSSGATGSGGVNMAMFVYLTHLSNALAMQGKSMVIAINPLIEDDRTSQFKSNLASAVAAVLTLEKPFVGTLVARPNRARVQNVNLAHDEDPKSYSPEVEHVFRVGPASASAFERTMQRMFPKPTKA